MQTAITYIMRCFHANKIISSSFDIFCNIKLLMFLPVSFLKRQDYLVCIKYTNICNHWGHK